MKLTDKKNTKSSQKASTHFPVVGIRIGGLDAICKLIKAVPNNSEMAYVGVQHLSPTHDSLLVELIQKITTIPIEEITDKIKILPNHIYIIPSK